MSTPASGVGLFIGTVLSLTLLWVKLYQIENSVDSSIIDEDDPTLIHSYTYNLLFIVEYGIYTICAINTICTISSHKRYKLFHHPSKPSYSLDRTWIINSGNASIDRLDMPKIESVEGCDQQSSVEVDNNRSSLYRIIPSSSKKFKHNTQNTDNFNSLHAERRPVWCVNIWNPKSLSLSLLSTLSPTHILLISYAKIGLLKSVFSLFAFSITFHYIISMYNELIRDREIIHAEVFNEYRISLSKSFNDESSNKLTTVKGPNNSFIVQRPFGAAVVSYSCRGNLPHSSVKSHDNITTPPVYVPLSTDIIKIKKLQPLIAREPSPHKQPSPHFLQNNYPPRKNSPNMFSMSPRHKNQPRDMHVPYTRYSEKDPLNNSNSKRVREWLKTLRVI